jgi:hypothetical protein
MEFKRQDLNQLSNLLKCLNRGKFELDGQEILAFADLIRWATRLSAAAEVEVQLAEAKARADAERKALEPKEVKDAIQPEQPVSGIAPKPKKGSKNERHQL